METIALPDVPSGVSLAGDKLYLTYAQKGSIQVLDLEAQSQSTIFTPQVLGQRPYPDSTALIDNQLAVTDPTLGTLGFFSPEGKLQDGFHTTPGGERLRPKGIFPFQQVYYLTDLALPGWRAVHRSGELLLSFKGKDEADKLVEPYGIVVTKDGRVIVSDPALGKIKVYSCSGWYAYDFDRGGKEKLLKPYGLAMDAEERIFVAGGAQKRVFVFNNVGQLQFSFPTNLPNPKGIAVDSKGKKVYLTGDSRELQVWKY